MSKNIFEVVTEEIRGGHEKSRRFIAEAEDYGKALYKYHQTVRTWGYDDCSQDGKHRLVKQGNVMDVAEVNEVEDVGEYDAELEKKV